jgi:hypothetical protein
MCVAIRHRLQFGLTRKWYFRMRYYVTILRDYKILCMKSLSLLLISALLVASFAETAPAQNLGQFIESYTARLSARDHFNSNGQRLRESAEIIRQDRANYYVYDTRDSEDQPDSFFSIKDNRARLEQLLANGRTTREAINAIVNGTPLIRVDIYQNGVSVTILSN